MFDFFEVGGAVRDHFLGIDSKDVDFVAVANQSFDDVESAFDDLHAFLEDSNFKVFLTTPEFLTIRAQVPDDHVLKNRTNVADFVLARKDGPSSNGRHPDWVKPGTLMDDLSRRDFTVNAMALDPVNGNLIDPFNGQEDLNNRTLRFVGNTMDRIEEDGLRILRALRFQVTKGLTMHPELFQFFLDNHVALGFHHLRSVSTDRIREELNKMFSANTLQTLEILEDFPGIRNAIFSNGDLKLLSTSKRF